MNSPRDQKTLDPFLMEEVRKIVIPPEIRITASNKQGLHKACDAINCVVAQPCAKPRVAFLAASWTHGGVERGLSTIFSELVDTFEILLITPQKDEKNHFPLPPEVKHFEIASAWTDSFPDRMSALCQLAQVKVAVNCVNITDTARSMNESLTGNGVRVISCNQENFFYPYLSSRHWAFVPIRMMALQAADVVTWLTTTNTRVYSLYADNAVTLPHPVPQELVKAAISRREGKTVLSVGRFSDSIKRVDRLLRCFAEVLKEVPDADLVLAGAYDMNLRVPDTSKKSVAKLIKSLGIPRERLHFIGSCEDTREYYEKACVFILASDSEGQPMVLLEAEAHAVPCVVQDIPGIDDLIEDGVTGFIVPQDDEAAMGKAVAGLLRNPERSAKMGTRAKKRLEQYFIADICTKWKFLLSTLTEGYAGDSLKSRILELFPRPDPVDDALAKQIYDVMKRVGRKYEA